MILIVIPISQSFAQGSAGTAAPYESRVIVDMPNAGVLSKNTLGLNAIAFGDGGILAECSVAPWTNVNAGIGFSGTRILGTGSVQWQDLPSLHLRYRFIDETLSIPAFIIGLQTLGRGVAVDNRFLTRAPGFFTAIGKQYRWALGSVSFHGGLGYSLDLNYNGAGVNVWGGIEQSLGSQAALLAEFNPQLQEKNSPLLNLSLRWAIVSGVTLELQGRDLFGKLRGSSGWTRTLAIEVIRRL